MSEDVIGGAGIKLEWSPQAVLKLIELFKEAPCLYNTKNSVYHNKHARAEALETMAKDMSETVPGITAVDIKTKLNYLRSQYGRELLRESESKKSGAGTDEVYVPSAYWFPHLHFIKDFVRVRKGKSNICLNLDEILLTQIDEQPCSSNRSQVDNDTSEDSTPLKKKKSNTTECDELLKTATDVLQKLTADQNPVDKFTEGLLTFISSSISEVKNRNLRDELASKIMILLFEYMKKQREQELL